MDPRHPYETLPLFGTGLVLAIWLIASHALMLAQPTMVKGWLQAFPRNQLAGQILLGVGLAWFWLLIAPPGLGKLSALGMDLGEFNGAKPFLRILVPVLLVLVTTSIRDFLAVRALGLVGLMVASPLLEAAFLEEPASRLLIPIFAYALITNCLFWVGMPYLFRDAVSWVLAKPRRWTIFASAGLLYGVAVLVCAFAFWRGY